MKNVKLNMNGDDGESLLVELRRAYMAVTAALDEVSKLTTHQRNYQNYVEPSEYYRRDYEAKREALVNCWKMIDWLALSHANISGQMYEAELAKSPAEGEFRPRHRVVSTEEG